MIKAHADPRFASTTGEPRSDERRNFSFSLGFLSRQPSDAETAKIIIHSAFRSVYLSHVRQTSLGAALTSYLE